MLGELDVGARQTAALYRSRHLPVQQPAPAAGGLSARPNTNRKGLLYWLIPGICTTVRECCRQQRAGALHRTLFP
ncbi:conserved hypothetical protein [Cupriavidus necator]|uniref:Uncharacterized protein n=1 Tax=Cupriavidus necator TaxID=106590 RepID=A0A1K0INX2_CUPNE|nr:conserved hypothetical protein [Cupriavidus necator]